MELNRQLISAKPRETSGSRASQGFSYQRDWALCLLIELHTNRDDYAVLFDYFDDVVVLDSATVPTAIDFYQIKKRRDGVIKLNYLIRRTKTKGKPESMSVLGKMVSNYLAFPAHTASLNHVTNLRYSMDMADGKSCLDMIKICLCELDKKTVDQVKRQIMEEHGLASPPEIDGITYFLVSSLSPDDAGSHTRGKLSDFLEHVLPDRRIAIGPLYRCLASEIERHNNRIADAKTFDDLIKQKSLTKADMIAMLGDLPAAIDVEGFLAHAWVQLGQDGMVYPEVEEWKKAVKRYELERTNKANTVLSLAVKAVREALSQVEKDALYKTLSEKIHLAAALAAKDSAIKIDLLGRTYLEGITLYHEVCHE